MVTEDLSKSLCNHHEWVQEGASDLEAFIYKLTSHPLLVKHSNEVTATVEKFKQTAAMKPTTTLCSTWTQPVAILPGS